MEQLITFLSGTGVAGAVLAWFMMRLETRLQAMAEAINTSTRADLLRIAASPHVASELKEVAKSMIQEIDQLKK